MSYNVSLPKYSKIGPLKSRRMLLTLAVLLIFNMPAICHALAEESVGGFTVEPVAIITLDDQGRKFSYPSSVFFDPIMLETYVLNNGKSRIVVFGPEFFPRVSLGAGRGVDGPTGMYSDAEGRLFICQRKTAANPTRITILNAAFFKEKEFQIQGFEGAENFIPQRLTIGKHGTIYVAGGQPGVMVLDQDGNYLRHLTPQDRVLMGKKPEKDVEKPDSDSADQMTPAAEDLDLPSELMPKMEKAVAEEESPYRLGPVFIVDVTSDNEGNLYLLSQETSKTYVYSPEEKFLFSFGEKGGSEAKLSQPRGIALDNDKRIAYVVDYMRHTVLAYNMTNGKFLFEFAGKGWSPGWLQYPSDLAVDHKGRVIVADTFNQRIQVLEIQFKVQTPKESEHLPSSRIPSEMPNH